MKTIHPHHSAKTARRLPVALLFAACGALSLSELSAQTIWIGASGNGNNGNWASTSHWSTGALPTNSGTSQFYRSATYTAASATISVTGDRRSDFMELGLGKSVTLSLDNSSAAINSRQLVSVGTDIAASTGTGAAHLTYAVGHTSDKTATVRRFLVGDSDGVSGSSLTFTGSLLVVETYLPDPLNPPAPDHIGNQGSNSTMTVSSGARVTRHGINVAANTSFVGNGVLVTGTNSRLTVNGGDSVSRLNVGSLAFTGGITSQENYDGAAMGNFLEVEGGGLVSTDGLALGNAENARSNFASIEGANSVLEILGTTSLQIGNVAGLGGNFLTVHSGGLVRTGAVTTISAFTDNDGFNDGANRLTVGPTGAFHSSSTLQNSGLLQLATGGTIAGKNLAGDDASLTIAIQSGGRFEAEGAGLAGTVTTTVATLGTLAVGLTDPVSQTRSGPAVFTLQSEIQFTQEAFYEIAIFSDTGIDQTHFGLGGTFDLTGDVTLRISLIGYTPTIGDSWTVFTGNTSGIGGIGQFDVSELDPGVWDTSLFNEAGGWQLSVVPEPSTVALGLVGVLGLFLRRSRRAAPVREA